MAQKHKVNKKYFCGPAGDDDERGFTRATLFPRSTQKNSSRVLNHAFSAGVIKFISARHYMRVNGPLATRSSFLRHPLSSPGRRPRLPSTFHRFPADESSMAIYRPFWFIHRRQGRRRVVKRSANRRYVTPYSRSQTKQTIWKNTAPPL